MLITEINFVLVKSYSISPIRLQHIINKLCSCIFKVPFDHLFDNLESRKKEIQKLFWQKKSLEKNSNMCYAKICANPAFDLKAFFEGAVSRNSAKLGNYKMPVKLRET